MEPTMLRGVSCAPRPPAGIANITGLKSKTCTPIEAGDSALEDAAVENFRRQVPGWRRMAAAAGGDAAISYDWKVRVW